jgi:hypothetical protein
MKKKIMLAVIAAAVLGLAGCGTDIAELPEESMMIIVDHTTGYTIYANKETGVMYFCRGEGYGKSVCVMLNADGTPQIWEG